MISFQLIRSFTTCLLLSGTFYAGLLFANESPFCAKLRTTRNLWFPPTINQPRTVFPVNHFAPIIIKRNGKAETLTVGIEFEGLLSQGNKQDLGQKLVQFLGDWHPHSIIKSHPTALVDRFGKTSNIQRILVPSRGREPMTWDIKTDDSLRFYSLDYTDSMEITSPILERPRDFQIFRSLWHQLPAFLVRPYPVKGGIHIHYGLKSLSASDYDAVETYFRKLETQIWDLFHVMPTRRIYPLGKGDPLMVDLLYRPEMGTIEVRLLNSSTSFDYLATGYLFFGRLIQAILSPHHPMQTYFATRPYPDLRTVFMHLGIRYPASTPTWHQLNRDFDQSYPGHGIEFISWSTFKSKAAAHTFFQQRQKENYFLPDMGLLGIHDISPQDLARLGYDRSFFYSIGRQYLDQTISEDGGRSLVAFFNSFKKKSANPLWPPLFYDLLHYSLKEKGIVYSPQDRLLIKAAAKTQAPAAKTKIYQLLN